MQNVDSAFAQLTPSMALPCADPTSGVVTMAQLADAVEAALAGTAVTASHVPSNKSAAATRRPPAPM
jgi:hypothetical protein